MTEATLTRQLSRMRGMTRYYHEQFFGHVRETILVSVGLFALGWWAVPEAFLLLPFVAVLGANQTAFDASYLMFSRHYARSLEQAINREAGFRWLVGAELEDRYLFPLDETKIVTIPLGRKFTWFAWMTLLYTLAGVTGFGFGLALGWETLSRAGSAWVFAYVAALGLLTLGSLVTGTWWFVSGEGERRLASVLEARFGGTPA